MDQAEPTEHEGFEFHYHYTAGDSGYGSDADGLDFTGLSRLVRMDSSSFKMIGRSSLPKEISRTLLPWLLSTLLGVLTALTGTCIALTSDFLGDLRIGFCEGLPFADRNRCCGGSENVNVLTERCLVEDDSVRWVRWLDYFNVVWMGSTAFSFLIYATLSMLLTGIAMLLVHEFSPSARGSGIPDVKAAVSGFDLPQCFSGSCLLMKTLGLSLAVGAGLSLGKEGPLIHIGVCWAGALARIIRCLRIPGGSALPLHDFACAGAAAGVATAFGAPLGGVLFVAEELGSVRALGRRSLLFAFTAAVSASFLVKHMNLSGANRLTLFSLATSTHNPRKEWHSWEMIAYSMIGVSCGLIGAFFVRVNLWWTRLRRLHANNGRLWQVPNFLQDSFLTVFPCFRNDGPGLAFTPLSLNIAEGVVIAIMTAMLNYPFLGILRAPSMEGIHAMFEACPGHRGERFDLCEQGGPAVDSFSCLGLVLAACMRVFQTSYTFGAALPSGLFIPSMFIGATLGRLMGNIVYTINENLADETLRFHVEPGTFAMVGAVAMLSGFCRMTVSLVVIMFELTGELTYLVPFMCAVLAAKLVGDPLTPSIYDGHAKLNGIAPIEEQHDIRLDMVVDDLSDPVKRMGMLDISEAVSLSTLQDLVRTLCEAEADEAPHRMGPGYEGQAVPKPVEILILHRELDDVVGVVEVKKLARWVARTTATQLEFLNTRPEGVDSGSTRISAGAASRGTSPATSEKGSKSSARTSSRQSSRERRFVWFRQSQMPEQEPYEQPLLDARELVDTNVVRLAPHAPLLTAWCIFTEKPKLRWCICGVSDRKKDFASYSILSRDAFEAALVSAKYPLAHPLLSWSGHRPDRDHRCGTELELEMSGIVGHFDTPTQREEPRWDTAAASPS